MRQGRRIAGQPRVRTLLHLGSAYHMPQEQWPEITPCLSIMRQHQDSSAGLPQLVPFDPAVREEAQRILLLLQAKEEALAPTMAAAGVVEGENASPSAAVMEKVDIMSIRISPTVTVGPERLALHALGLLDLEGFGQARLTPRQCSAGHGVSRGADDRAGGRDRDQPLAAAQQCAA